MIQFRNTLCFDRRQVIQHTDRAFTIIADGSYRNRRRAMPDRVRHSCPIAPFHRQIVGENHPVKAQFAAQHRFSQYAEPLAGRGSSSG